MKAVDVNYSCIRTRDSQILFCLRSGRTKLEKVIEAIERSSSKQIILKREEKRIFYIRLLYLLLARRKSQRRGNTH